MDIKDLVIGNIYFFEYDKPASDKKRAEVERIKVQLKEKTIKNLIDEISFEGKQRKIRNLEIHDWLSIKDLISQRYDKNRKKPGTLAKIGKVESELRSLADRLEKDLFQPQKKTTQQKACDLFIRDYNPEHIKNWPDFSIKEMQHAISAVYAGEQITKTGKRVYTWYNISNTNIQKDRFDEKFMIEIKEK